MAENLVLLRSQKNDVLAAIQQAGLTPSDFEWKDGLYSDVSSVRLVHRHSDYSFTFFVASVGFSPSSDSVKGYVGDLESWLEKLLMFRKWLPWLKREIETPDLWAAVSEEKAFSESASVKGGTNEPFNRVEVRQIATFVTELKEFLYKTRELDEAQKQFVDDRMKYLAESAERMGRKDWINLALGVLTSIVVQLSLPPDAARELFRLAGSLFHSLFGGVPQLP